MAACIVMKPGALNLARYAYEQNSLMLNIGDGTYKWAVKQGWPTPDSGNFLHWLFARLLGIRKDWMTEFKKKAIENEENLRLVIYESGADIMVPHELFVIENDSYIIKLDAK